MKKTMRFSTSLLALLVCGASWAADPVPKKGTVSGTYGWHYASGQNLTIDKDHIIWGGVVAGPFVGDGASGLLHAAAASCTFSGEYKNGAVTHNTGDCVVIDADGDKVVLNWKCTKCPNGELLLTAGTGKYAGIRGGGSYQEFVAGPLDSDSGWSVWKLKWELP